MDECGKWGKNSNTLSANDFCCIYSATEVECKGVKDIKVDKQSCFGRYEWEIVSKCKIGICQEKPSFWWFGNMFPFSY